MQGVILHWGELRGSGSSALLSVFFGGWDNHNSIQSRSDGLWSISALIVKYAVISFSYQYVPYLQWFKVQDPLLKRLFKQGKQVYSILQQFPLHQHVKLIPTMSHEGLHAFNWVYFNMRLLKSTLVFFVFFFPPFLQSVPFEKSEFAELSRNVSLCRKKATKAACSSKHICRGAGAGSLRRRNEVLHFDTSTGWEYDVSRITTQQTPVVVFKLKLAIWEIHHVH